MTMVGTGDFIDWLHDFEGAALLRRTWGDPDWSAGARLEPALVRSLQRFQVGEDSDGAHLTDKVRRAGDPVYAEAVRLFVAEEREHARPPVAPAECAEGPEPRSRCGRAAVG